MSHSTDLQALPRYATERFNAKTRGKVRKDNFRKDRESLMIQADCVIFVNRGQNFCLIDGMFFLEPGGTLKLRNVSNDFNIRFGDNASPPTADGFRVITGNHLMMYALNGDGDVDCDIQISNPANISTGDITVDITPATAGAITKSEGYTLTTPTIPATCYRVYLKNVGSTIEGGVDAPITINGNSIAVGESREFNAVLDPVTNVYKYVTGVTTTNASGAGIYFEIDS